MSTTNSLRESPPPSDWFEAWVGSVVSMVAIVLFLLWIFR